MLKWMKKILQAKALDALLVVPFAQITVRLLFDALLCSIVLLHLFPALTLILLFLTIYVMYEGHVILSLFFFFYMFLSFIAFRKNEMKYKVGGLILQAFMMERLNGTVLNLMAFVILIGLHVLNLMRIAQ